MLGGLVCFGVPDLKRQADGTARSSATTNAIESINARIRRAVNARGHFPTEQAALKCVYLAIMSLDRVPVRVQRSITAPPTPTPPTHRSPVPTGDDLTLCTWNEVIGLPAAA